MIAAGFLAWSVGIIRQARIVGVLASRSLGVAVLVLGIGGAMVLFIALWRVEIEQSFEVRPADKVTCKSPCAWISTPFICDFVLGRLR